MSARTSWPRPFADTFDTIDKALERLKSLYRPRAIVSEVIDGGSQLPTARPELTLPTVYSAPGECPLASGFALAPFPGKPCCHVSLDDDSLATSHYLVAWCQMFIPPSKTYFRRSITLQRKIMSWAVSSLRPDRVRAPRGLNGVDALRQRLEAANRRVAESRRLVAGWRDIIERERAAGHDVSVVRDLLETFQTRLEVAMAEKDRRQKPWRNGSAISLRESKAVRRRMIRSYRNGSPRPTAKPLRRLNRPRFRHGAREAGPNRPWSTAHRLRANQLAPMMG
jgi:hypothetical protein